MELALLSPGSQNPTLISREEHLQAYIQNDSTQVWHLGQYFYPVPWPAVCTFESKHISTQPVLSNSPIVKILAEQFRVRDKMVSGYE